MLEEKQLKKEREAKEKEERKKEREEKKKQKEAEKKKAEERARKAEEQAKKRDEKQASSTQRKRSSTRTRVQEAQVDDGEQPRPKKAQTEVEDKSQETQSNRRAVMKSLILTMMNVVHVLARMRKMFYLVWDASGFSVLALDGSTKTVWRIVQ